MIRQFRLASCITFIAGAVVGISLFSLFLTLFNYHPHSSFTELPTSRHECVSWTSLPDTQVFGGNADIATSVDDCKAACAVYPGCDGIDWVEDDPTGSQCWLSGPWITGKNKGTAYGVMHYLLIDLCGKALRGQSIIELPADEQHLQLESQKGDKIKGGDTNRDNEKVLKFLKFNKKRSQKVDQNLKVADLTIDENSIPNNNNRLKRLDCDPTWTWEEMPNTKVVGGKGNDATSLAACQSSCITFPGCNGIDWSPEFPIGQKCWLSGSWSLDWINGTAKGVTHYILTYSCNKASSNLRVTEVAGCETNWKPMKNSQVMNGRPLMAETLILCQKACAAYPGCDGLDWNPDEAIGFRCWLSGPWISGWNNGSAPAVTHYIRTTNC